MIDSFKRDQFLRMNYLDRKKRFLTVFQIHEKNVLDKAKVIMIVRERPICRLWQGYEIICERKKGRLFKEMEDSILKKARADRLDSPSQKKPDFLFSSERGRWDQITMPFWEDTFKRPRLTPFKSYRICYNTRYSHCTLANSFICDE